MPKDNTAKRRGKEASATSTVVEPTAPPNPEVDAQLEAIGVALDGNQDAPEVPLQPDVSPAAPPTPEQLAPDAPAALEAAPPPPVQPPVPLAARSGPPADPETLNPFTRQPAPEPKPSKNRQRQDRADNRETINKTTPSTRRFGSMGNKLPGAEHILVRKRTESGQMAYIGEFNSTDLAHSQNVESYIARYLQPKFGPGEYWVFGVDVAGREFDAGYVQLLPAADDALMGTPGGSAHAGGTSPLSLIQQMLDRESTRRDAELRALSSKKDKDPIELMRQMHNLQKEMAPVPPLPALKSSEKGSNTTDTVLGGMMQMMTTVLAQAMQPNPLMVALIQKLTDKADTPAPAGADPSQQLLVLSEVVKNLGGNKGPDVSSQMLEMLMKERMAPSDVLSLVQQVKGERGTDDLKKSMENLGFLLNAVQQLRSHTEPGGSGFWDAINSIFSNPGLANAIGNKVSAIAQTNQAQALRPGQGAPPSPQQLPPGVPPGQQPPARDPLALKARELIARKQRIDEVELLERERRAGISPAPGAPPGTQPAQVDAPPAADPAVVEPIPAAAAAPVADVSIPATPNQQVALPSRITDHLNGYTMAKDDGDYVRTTIELVFSLANDAEWRPYSEVILSFIVQNNRAKFMHYMSSMFTALRTSKLLDDALAHKIMDALQRNFDTIVSETLTHLQALQEAEGLEDGMEEPEGDEGELDPADDALHLNEPNEPI